MTELSFASMKSLLEDNWGDGTLDNVIQVIVNANSNNTILQYGKDISTGDEKAALEFGERAIKNRIPFLMIAFSKRYSPFLGRPIESIQLSEFRFLTIDDTVLLQKWDVDTEPSGLYEDESVWTEEEVKEYFNAKALQINVVDDWALQGRELKMNVRQDFVMIIYSGILIPIPINFLADFPLEEELRERVSDTKA